MDLKNVLLFQMHFSILFSTVLVFSIQKKAISIEDMFVDLEVLFTHFANGLAYIGPGVVLEFVILTVPQLGLTWARCNATAI